MRSRVRSERGFTLVELLVVIAIIGVLAALLMPAVKDALLKGRMTRSVNNGRNIYQVLTAVSLDSGVAWPRTEGEDGFDNSTDYWKWAVSNRLIDVTFKYFSAYGMTSCPGIDPAAFEPDHNAWCIVADVSDSMHSSTPVMFTRNLEIDNLSDDLSGALTDNPPFGKRGVVVVTAGGSVRILRESELAEHFNPAGEDKPVLRP